MVFLVVVVVVVVAKVGVQSERRRRSHCSPGGLAEEEAERGRENCVIHNRIEYQHVSVSTFGSATTWFFR